MLQLLGLIAGIVIGLALNVEVPPAYVRYLGIAVLAALDSVLGGLRARLENKFNDRLFIAGFLSNTLMATLFVYIGDKLGVELYLAAVVAFGVRLFQNLARVRQYLFKTDSPNVRRSYYPDMLLEEDDSEAKTVENQLPSKPN
jgi:small basic protein